jgi:arginase
VRSEDVVAFGYRDHEDQAKSGSQPPPSDLRAYDLPTLRQMDIAVAAQEAVAHLTRPELDGFFIHLDADVLDDAVMPAVDFRAPGGLSGDDLRAVLDAALESPHAIGMEITIYNPQLDGDGSAGRLLASLLADVLAPS